MTLVCENCGNHYDKAFKVLINNEEHVFDSFECAINKVAPHCEHCDARIIGHGVEVHDKFFCCRHCADAMSMNELVESE
jgi:hypothetical protein